jgi:hypothetical protein
MNKNDGHPAAPGSLKFSLQVHGRMVSNVHAEQTQRPRRIILVQDASASMRDSNARQPSMQAIQDFVGFASADDQLALVDFNDSYYLDITPRSAAAFLEKYNDPKFQQSIRFFNGTALFDAVVASASYLEKEPQEGDSIVIISDGADDASKTSSQELERELRGSKIRVYLLLLPAPKHKNPYDDRSRSAMMDLVRAAGGVVGEASSGDTAVRQWVEMVHGLIEVTNKVDFDLDAPLREPSHLEVALTNPDGKRDKTLETSCPRFVGP